MEKYNCPLSEPQCTSHGKVQIYCEFYEFTVNHVKTIFAKHFGKNTDYTSLKTCFHMSDVHDNRKVRL